MGLTQSAEERRAELVYEADSFLKEFEPWSKRVKKTKGDEYYLSKAAADFKEIYRKIIAIRVGSDAEDLLTRFSRAYQKANHVLYPQTYTQAQPEE
jgi:hypothetical protein